MLVDALRLRLLRQIDETKSTVMELTLPRQRASISASASPTHLGSRDIGVVESEPVVGCLQVLQLKRDTSPEGMSVAPSPSKSRKIASLELGRSARSASG